MQPTPVPTPDRQYTHSSRVGRSPSCTPVGGARVDQLGPGSVRELTSGLQDRVGVTHTKRDPFLVRDGGLHGVKASVCGWGSTFVPGQDLGGS